MYRRDYHESMKPKIKLEKIKASLQLSHVSFHVPSRIFWKRGAFRKFLMENELSALIQSVGQVSFHFAPNREISGCLPHPFLSSLRNPELHGCVLRLCQLLSGLCSSFSAEEMPLESCGLGEMFSTSAAALRMNFLVILAAAIHPAPLAIAWELNSPGCLSVQGCSSHSALCSGEAAGEDREEQTPGLAGWAQILGIGCHSC